MSERYSRLFSLSENLYSEGAPVLIAAGALLKDNETGKVLAQIKIRNIGSKVIKAATVSILPLDVVGSPLGDVVEYQYLDLNAARDNEFGQKTAVSLPDASTRAYSVIVSEVIFSDNSIWHDDGVAWEPLTKQQTLAKAFDDNELVKQYKLKYGSKCDYVFQEEKDLWMCSCGCANRNTESQCHSCGAKIETLNSFDLNTLKSVCAARLAEERKQAEKEQAAAAAKAKKTKRIVSIVAPVLIIAVVAGVFITTTIQKKQQELAAAAAKEETYNAAVELMNNGKALEAYNLFSELDDYKDAASYELVVNACLLNENITYYINGKVNNSTPLNYTYNDAGQLIEIASSAYLTGTTTFTYDENGNLTKSTTNRGWAGKEGEGDTCVVNSEYNEYGDVVKETIIYSSRGSYRNGDVVVHTFTYEYNEQKDKTFMAEYIDGEFFWSDYYAYEYDADGKIIKSEETSYFDKDGNVTLGPSQGSSSTLTSKYFYDDMGLLVKIAVYAENGNKIREVEYSYSKSYTIVK